jgi:hypothetical protein
MGRACARARAGGRLNRPLARLLLAAALSLAAAQSARVMVTGSLMSGDAVYHFCHLHTLVVDRDLDPTNEIAHYQHARSPYTGFTKIGNAPPIDPDTGRAIDKYPIGTALLLLPAYLVVYAGASALSAVGIGLDVSGYGWSYQLAAGWLTAVYAVLGLLAMIRICRHGGIAESDALAATATIALATPWLFYVTLEPLFAHALSATAVAVLIWAWLAARSRDRATIWVLTGVVGGLAAIIRYQDALFLIVPALDAMLHARRRALPLAALTLGALIGASPQLAVNAVLFGSPFHTGYAAEGFTHLASPWLLFTLFSSKAGLLRWSPIVLLSLFGLALGARRGWIVARLGLLAFAIQWYVVSSWYFVSQGHTFGNRMLTNCTVLLVAGLAEMLRRVRSGATGATGATGARAALLALCVAAILTNFVLIGLWAVGRIGPLSR